MIEDSSDESDINEEESEDELDEYLDDTPDYSGITMFTYDVYFNSSQCNSTPPNKSEILTFLEGNNQWDINFREPDEYGFALDLPFETVIPSMMTKEEDSEAFAFDKGIFKLDDLSENELKTLNESDSIFRLRYMGPNFEDKRHILFILLLAEINRKKFDGIVFDSSAYVFWSDASWLNFVLKNVIQGNYMPDMFVTIHEAIFDDKESENQNLWMHTHGLGRFGVPEIEILNVRRDLWKSAITTLLNLAEDCIDGTIISPGDILFNEDKHKIKVVEAKSFYKMEPKEHYEFGKAIRLVDAEDTDEMNLGKFLRNLDEIIREEEVLSVKHDEEVKQAHLQAIETLHRFIKLWQNRAENQYRFNVKIGFDMDITEEGEMPEDSGREWMWLAVENWQDDILEGILDSNPIYRSDLQAGDPVRFRESDIFDWMVFDNMGEIVEGGFVQKIIEQRRKKEEE